MAASRPILPFFIFFILFIGTRGIQEGDIDGGLGSGHSIESPGGPASGPLGTPHKGIFSTGVVFDIEDHHGCCEACRENTNFPDRKNKYGRRKIVMRNAPDTEMYNYYGPYTKHCQCLARDSSGQRPVSHNATYFSGVCDGSVEVEGGVGVGRKFQVGTVEMLGRDHYDKVYVDDKLGCCQGCKDALGEEAIMFESSDWIPIEGCRCFKLKPGITPVTQSFQFYAGICALDN